MKLSKRIVAGLSGTVLAASALMIVGASPASAVNPSGGCWVYSVTPGDPIESTAPAGNTSSTLAPWTDPALAPTGNADWTITSSGSTLVGGTRNFDVTFNKGPKNGGPAANGTAYYYISVNGVNQPAITSTFNVGAGAVIPGTTVSGSYTIASAGTNTLVLRKVIYDIPSFVTRVGCNGQSGGTAGGTNPATTPIDTNVTSAFTATGPTATISAISNQTVTNAGRKNDVISFSVTNFTDGTGTASLCSTSGTSCDAGTSPVTISGGNGAGTLAIGATPTVGARALKVVSGGDTALVPITILDTPTISTNVGGGGAGTVVAVTGGNWDPNLPVTVGGFKANPNYPCSPIPCGPYVATSDATVSTTANAAGNINTSFTVNDPTTTLVGGSRNHQGFSVVIFGGQPFTFSGDTCTAKVGLAVTGQCALIETVNLTITAGDLKMTKASGPITMSGITNNGAAQTSTGSLQDVTVNDYRGGALGWSLVGRFSGLTGPLAPTSGNYTLPPTAMTWTPSCTAAGNNNDTVVQGAAGAFTSALADLPLCSVSTTGLGLDLTSGGDTAADAALSLAVPANQASGAYSGTITLTLS